MPEKYLRQLLQLCAMRLKKAAVGAAVIHVVANAPAAAAAADRKVSTPVAPGRQRTGSV